MKTEATKASGSAAARQKLNWTCWIGQSKWSNKIDQNRVCTWRDIYHLVIVILIGCLRRGSQSYLIHNRFSLYITCYVYAISSACCATNKLDSKRTSGYQWILLRTTLKYFEYILDHHGTTFYCSLFLNESMLTTWDNLGLLACRTGCADWTPSCLQEIRNRDTLEMSSHNSHMFSWFIPPQFSFADLLKSYIGTQAFLCTAADRLVQSSVASHPAQHFPDAKWKLHSCDKFAARESRRNVPEFEWLLCHAVHPTCEHVHAIQTPASA